MVQKHYKTFLKYIFLLMLVCVSFSVEAGNITSNHTAQVCENAACTVSNTSPINFGVFTDPLASPFNVTVTNTELTGLIWGKSFGWVVLNCVNTIAPGAPGGLPGSGCTPANGNFKVTNDSHGNLSGWAWGETSGWINFNSKANCDLDKNGFTDVACDGDNTTTAIVDFKVTINSLGQFNGYAWAQNQGYIKFDCPNSDYCVETTWRPPSDGGGGGGGGGGPTKCVDPNATNNGGPLPCTYPPYCTLHPTDPSCVTHPPYCTQYPNDPSCNPPPPPYCATHPTDPACNPTPTFCTLYPTDPACTTPPSYCTLHPTDPSCVPPPGCTGTNCIVPPPGCTGPSCINPPVCLYCTLIDPIKEIPGGIIGKIIIGAGALFGAIFTFSTALFANPITFSEIFLIPIRLWSLFLSALGLKKRNRPWGIVYDSVTKQPLDPAYVILQDLEGNEVTTSITDLDGRYGFLVPAGKYRMIAHKTNYEFPSRKLAGKKSDELYSDLYFNEIITINEDEVITKNIPMDPLNFDWNEFAKRDQKLMKFYSVRDVWITRLVNTLFYFGFALTTVAVIVTPVTYNIVTFILYIVLFTLKHTVLKPRPFGKIRYKGSGIPVSFAVLRVFAASIDREVIKKVSDRNGKYYCLVPNGTYYVKIEQKNVDESYSPLYTSAPIEVKNGYINKKFEV